MPKIFRPKDIDQMNVADISQEFVDYYYRLSEERKKIFAKNRPDLCSVILAWNNNTDENLKKEFSGKIIDEVLPFTDIVAIENKPDTIDEEIDSDLEAIKNNVYEGKDIFKIVKDDFRPLEALTIEDRQTKCPAHRVPLIEYNPIFHKPNGAIFGIKFYHCPECNRLFIKRSKLESNMRHLDEWGVSYNFYDFDTSNKYLMTQVKQYELSSNEKIYIPDQWIEENPMCPIHGITLGKLPCILKYGGKTISFDAYYCDECMKVILRRTSALKLEDRCAQNGIPLIEFEPLVKRIPPKDVITKKKIKPDYFMDEGKRLTWSFANIPDYYELTETDTVVVSDSIYCTLDGHETENVLGLVWVKERQHGNRRLYLFKLGYCAECRKYYMDILDYKAVYKIGRLETTLLIDIDDDSYMISSGEVFNAEQKHLKSVEDIITHEMDSIYSQPDYISPYATLSYYDDGDLAYKKRASKEKYEGQLEVLFSYKPRPYEYRVDISANGKTEVYYVGSNDININNNHQVISANSKFGRELVHYQTIKVKKDGIEYNIKLSRQFDINEASLFGYTNLRTDEDIIFRSGITDPFLVHALNMRKKQHNLIDIFVTIQECQNSIVDAEFGKSLIVQGCAGSGKTMVLLHRLSSLKYNRQDFDFNRDAFILTPNDNFTLHIKGLADSLQIGSIKRASVEQYYANLLGKYSKDLEPSGNISSEMSVKQIFVDYIYSDEFRQTFEKNYSEVISTRNKLVPEIRKIAEMMGEKYREVDLSDDSKVVPQLKNVADSFSANIAASEKKISDTALALQEKQKQKESLFYEIPQKRDYAIKTLKDIAQRVKTKALTSLLKMKDSIDGQKDKLIQACAEKDNLGKIIVSSAQNSNITFAEYIKKFSSWIDDDISEKIKSIDEMQSEINLKKENIERLENILSIPIDVLIVSGESEDTDIANNLAELLSDYRNIEQFQAEKNKVENGWVFGRIRRLSVINSQIEKTEKSIEAHKLKIESVLEDRRNEYNDMLKVIESLNVAIVTKSDDIKNSIKQNQKKRLAAIDRQIKGLTSYIDNQSTVFSEYVNTVNDLNDKMEEVDIVNWLNSVSAFVPEVNDEIVLYDRLKKEITQYEKIYSEMDEKIATAQTSYDEALSGSYSEVIKDDVRYLQDKIAEYSVLGTYQIIFDNTVQSFKEKNKIKSISGKWHRYDLYALLLFAMKYYGKSVGHIKFLCVDEAQDISLNEYRLIKELNGNNLILNLFGDTNQLIKENRGISNWDSVQKAFQANLFILNENYRNTNQITRFCNDSFGMDVLQTGVDGASIREITKNEFDNELSRIHLTTERVAILLPRGVQKKKYIECGEFYSKIKSFIGEEIGNGKIAVMYVDEVKGIEFDKVYVIPNKMGRNEKYIAYTRALSELIVVVDENIPSYSDEDTLMF